MTTPPALRAPLRRRGIERLRGERVKIKNHAPPKISLLGGVPAKRVVAFSIEINQQQKDLIMRYTNKYKNLPYNPALKERAKNLRQAKNLSEVILWNQIKNRQLFSLDFDRQKIIGNYITDFFCAEIGLVIEVDGSSHAEKIEYDAVRDDFLNALDLTVIHIRDVDVKNNLSGVMTYLKRVVSDITCHK
jgi:very-short-patch-repair endonuclease